MRSGDRHASDLAFSSTRGKHEHTTGRGRSGSELLAERAYVEEGATPITARHAASRAELAFVALALEWDAGLEL